MIPCFAVREDSKALPHKPALWETSLFQLQHPALDTSSLGLML